MNRIALSSVAVVGSNPDSISAAALMGSGARFPLSFLCAPETAVELLLDNTQRQQNTKKDNNNHGSKGKRIMKQRHLRKLTFEVK